LPVIHEYLQKKINSIRIVGTEKHHENIDLKFTVEQFQPCCPIWFSRCCNQWM